MTKLFKIQLGTCFRTSFSPFQNSSRPVNYESDSPLFKSYGGEKSVAGTFLEPPEGIDPDCLLFLGDPLNKTGSRLQRYWYPGAMGVGLLIGSLFANRAGNLPYRAGFYRHILCGLAGVAIGEGVYRLATKWQAEKDLQYYHYMIMHPEDFPAPERKKFSQVLRPWIPVR